MCDSPRRHRTHSRRESFFIALLAIACTVQLLGIALPGPTPVAAEATSSIFSGQTTIVNRTLCMLPVSVFADANSGIVYSACYTGVFATSIATGVSTLIASTTYCPFPESVHANSATSTVYVACGGTGTNSIISIGPSPTYTITVLATQTTCATAVSVRYNPTAGILYGACSKTGIVSITGTTLTVLVSASTCALPTAVTVNPSTGYVYFTCLTAQAIGVIAGSSVAVLSTGACYTPTGLDIDVTTNVLYASCGSAGGVLAFSGSLTSIVTTVVISPADCAIPTSVAVHEASNTIYATCAQSGVVALVDGSVLVPIATTATCLQAASATVVESTGQLFVACSLGPGFDTSVVSFVGVTVTPLINLPSLCNYPVAVAVNSSTGLVYALCSDATEMFSIDGSHVTPITASWYHAFDMPMKMRSSSTTGTVYIAGGLGQNVLAVSGSNVSSLTALNATFCAQVSGVAVNEATRVVFATCTSQSRNTTIAILPSGVVVGLTNNSQCFMPGDVAVDQSSGYAYVACQAGGINGTGVIAIKGTVSSGSQLNSALNVAAISSSKCPSSASVYVTNGRLFAGCSTGVYMVTLSTGVAVRLASSSVCASASAVTVNPVTGVVYAACGKLNAVLAIYNQTTTSVGGYSAVAITNSSYCPAPFDVKVSPDGAVVYAACGYSGSVVALSSRLECPAGFTLTDGGCVECAIGLYRNSSRVSSHVPACATCPSGSVAPATGSTSCTVCAPSTYAAASTLSCQTCAAGTYSSSWGATSCTQCKAGYYGSSAGASTATCSGACSAGYWCPAGSTSSKTVVCGARAFYCPTNSSLPLAVSVGMQTASPADASNPNATMTTQVACSTGHYCDGSGVPISCAPGTYQDSTGQSSCKACAAGQYQSGSGATSCSSCSGQTYSSTSGATSCTTCSGTVSSDHTSCAATTVGGSGCPAGYWCTSGTTSVQVACGARSVYCPVNSTAPTAVSTGMYTISPADTSSADATMTAQTSCPTGSYCDGSGTSKVCTAGTYQDQTGQSSCKTCDAGFYSASNATTCTVCAAGYYSDSGSSKCTGCTPGTFKNASMSTCQDCPAGTFSGKVAATNCTTCATGAYSAAGAVYCEVCSPGSARQDGSDTCTTCPAGTASPLGLACVTCAAGTISSAGALYCTACLAGQTNQTNPVTGVQECVSCNPGSFSPNGESCVTCPAGTYASASGATSCTQCSAGTASNLTGRTTACPSCSAGSYASSSGSSECTACQAQTYSATSGATTCTYCADLVSADRTECAAVSCAANTEFSASSQSCTACALGQYSAAGDDCADCPLNSYTPSAGSGCFSCSNSAMSGLLCAGGLATVKAGYWAFLVTDASTGLEVYHTSACPEGFCPGTQLQTTTTTTASTTSAVVVSVSKTSDAVRVGSVSRVATNTTSAIVYCDYPRLNSASNHMCGECVDGYVLWNQRCVSCTGVNAGLVVGGLILSLALVSVLLWLASISGTKAGGLSMVLMYFLQTAALIIGSSSAYLIWLKWVNFSSNFTSTCIAPWSPLEQALAAQLIPPFLVAEIACIAVVHFLLHVLFRRNPSSGGDELRDSIGWDRSGRCGWLIEIPRQLTAKFSIHSYIGGAVAVLLFCFTQVARTSADLLYCSDVGSARLVFSTPSIDCDASDYKSYATYSVIVLVLYIVGLPLGVLALLWFDRRSVLRNQTRVLASGRPAEVPGEETSPDRVDFRARWGVLYAMYHERAAWYWTPTVLLRRGGAIAIAVALARSSAQKYMAFALLNLASLLAHLLVRPFTSEEVNHAESASYVVLVTISVLLTGYSESNPTSVQIALCVLVVLSIILVCGGIAYCLWRDQGDVTPTQRMASSEAYLSSPKSEVAMHEMNLTVNPAIDEQRDDDAAHTDQEQHIEPVRGHHLPPIVVRRPAPPPPLPPTYLERAED